MALSLRATFRISSENSFGIFFFRETHLRVVSNNEHVGVAKFTVLNLQGGGMSFLLIFLYENTRKKDIPHENLKKVFFKLEGGTISQFLLSPNLTYLD